MRLLNSPEMSFLMDVSVVICHKGSNFSGSRQAKLSTGPHDHLQRPHHGTVSMLFKHQLTVWLHFYLSPIHWNGFSSLVSIILSANQLKSLIPSSGINHFHSLISLPQMREDHLAGACEKASEKHKPPSRMLRNNHSKTSRQ